MKMKQLRELRVNGELNLSNYTLKELKEICKLNRKDGFFWGYSKMNKKQLFNYIMNTIDTDIELCEILDKEYEYDMRYLNGEF